MSIVKKIKKRPIQLVQNLHKAIGWMLRETGKRDELALLQLIEKHGKKMPRTMLRYAIEKFDPKTRKEILLNSRV